LHFWLSSCLQSESPWLHASRNTQSCPIRKMMFNWCITIYNLSNRVPLPFNLLICILEFFFTLNFTWDLPFAASEDSVNKNTKVRNGVVVVIR
jgi:hypothetical protein